MFTFGIFSTHLPYIAFVLFYGLFFFGGIDRASAGESGERRQFNPYVVSGSVNVDSDDGYKNLNGSICFVENADYEQLLLYEQKDNFFNCVRARFKAASYRFSWFSRPPPVA